MREARATRETQLCVGQFARDIGKVERRPFVMQILMDKVARVQVGETLDPRERIQGCA